MEEEENKVFVARRDLSSLDKNVSKRLIHSGLLLRIGGEYRIVEYMGDSLVHSGNIEYLIDESFLYDKYTWIKQKIGVTIQIDTTFDFVSQKMEQLMKNSKFNLTNHNCHIAQEATRKLLGWAEFQIGTKELEFTEIVMNLINLYGNDQKMY